MLLPFSLRAPLLPVPGLPRLSVASHFFSSYPSIKYIAALRFANIIASLSWLPSTVQLTTKYRYRHLATCLPLYSIAASTTHFGITLKLQTNQASPFVRRAPAQTKTGRKISKRFFLFLSFFFCELLPHFPLYFGFHNLSSYTCCWLMFRYRMEAQHWGGMMSAINRHCSMLTRLTWACIVCTLFLKIYIEIVRLLVIIIIYGTWIVYVEAQIAVVEKYKAFAMFAVMEHQTVWHNVLVSIFDNRVALVHTPHTDLSTYLYI